MCEMFQNVAKEGACIRMGGLGNQLFQMAATWHICHRPSIRKELVLLDEEHSTTSVHSKENLKQSIFQKFRVVKAFPRPKVSSEDDIDRGLFTGVCMGYFQHTKYVSPSFVSKLCIGPPLDLQQNCAFVHVRGGDYLKNASQDIGIERLRDYQVASKETIQKNSNWKGPKKWILFTNDLAQALNVLQIQILFPGIIQDEESSEVLCLKNMASCSAGGICAGSTFSWWAAYIGSLEWSEATQTIPKPFLPKLNIQQDFDQHRFTPIAYN